MLRHYFNFPAFAAALIVAATSTSGTALGADSVAERPTPPRIQVEPPRARPGDAVLLTVHGVRPADAGSASATVHGRKVRFFPVAGGIQGVVPLPVELEVGTLPIEVVLAPTPSSGTAEIRLSARLEIVDPHFPETRLSVEPKYIAPSAAEKKRMEEDQAAFREAFARPFEPPLFRSAFVRPRDANVTGQFGERRMFNGKKQSQHYGTDLAGAVGEPVLAANDGVVALVRDCFASGKSIAIAHGAGLFTVYFHLSGFTVQPGDRVVRGQQIGKVGATGRVTGPHLHFGVKVVDTYVDPDSVYRLAFGSVP